MRRAAAVTLKEIRTTARGGRFFRLRTGYGLLLAVVMLVDVISAAGGSISRGGSMVSWAVARAFAAWAMLQAALVLFAVPADARASAERERRQRTLPLLRISHLRPWELALGDTVSVLALSAMLSLAALPLLALLAWMGGLALGRALEVLALTGGLGFAGVAAALLDGYLPYGRGRHRGILLAFQAVLFGTLLLPGDWVSRFHPLVALYEAWSQIPTPSRTASSGAALAVCASTGIGLLAAAALALPAAATHRERRVRRPPVDRARPARKRAPLERLPVAWLVRVSREVPATWLALLLGIGVALALLSMGYLGSILAPCLYLVGCIWLAGILPRQRRSRTLTALAATPRTSRRIVSEIVWGGLPGYLAFLLPVGAAWIVVLAQVRLPPLGLSLVAIHLVGHSALALSLGLLFSTATRRRAWASASAVAALIVMHFLASLALGNGFVLADGSHWRRDPRHTALTLIGPVLGVLLLAIRRRRSESEGARAWLLVIGLGWLVPCGVGFAGGMLEEKLDEIVSVIGNEGSGVLLITGIAICELLVASVFFEATVSAFDRICGRAS